MTHIQKQSGKIAELNTLFISLDEDGQESALTVLRSLQFAQSVLKTEEPGHKPSHEYTEQN